MEVVERLRHVVEADLGGDEAGQVEPAGERLAGEEREVLLRDRVASVRDGDPDLRREHVPVEVDVESTTPRKVSNPFDEDAVLLIVGGKGGYVERDGHMVNEADVARRAAFGKK